jgi:hypothetical protein
MDPRMAGDDYATRRNRRTRTAIKDGITGTTSKGPSQRNTGVLWTRCNCHGQPANLRGLTGTKFTISYQRSTLTQDLASLVQQHRDMAGPRTGICMFFHALGGG